MCAPQKQEYAVHLAAKTLTGMQLDARGQGVQMGLHSYCLNGPHDQLRVCTPCRKEKGAGFQAGGTLTRCHSQDTEGLEDLRGTDLLNGTHGGRGDILSSCRTYQPPHRHSHHHERPQPYVNRQLHGVVDFSGRYCRHHSRLGLRAEQLCMSSDYRAS